MKTRQQDGLALIIVMLIVAIASTASVAMLSRQHLDIRRTSNSLYHGQASLYAMGVEQLAQQLLYEDFKDNKTDHLGEFGISQKMTLPVEGGYVSGYIEDLQGRFNLNSLSKDGDAGKVAEDRFKRLLKSLEIREDLSSAVVDWLDSNQDPRFPGGAEDNYYLGLERPYRTSNQLMISPSELLQVKDMSREDYDKLLPYVTALPKDAPININTASAEVLSSLADDISPSDVATVIQNRDKDPYKDVTELLSDKLFAGKTIKAEGLSVDSKFYVLYAEAAIGHVIRKHTLQLERDDKGKVETLIRLEGAL